MIRKKLTSQERDRWQRLARIAELHAELTKQPLRRQHAHISGLRKDITTLAGRRTSLRSAVDAVAVGETPPGAAVYLTARAEDLSKVQIARYQQLAQAEVQLAELKETAARAQARSDVLRKLISLGGKR